jgi:predicted TIM-barrel fold metal-dependent hydrolase
MTAEAAGKGRAGERAMTAEGVRTPQWPVDAAWLACGSEPALQPELPIIDPHHHLWDATRPRYLLDELLGDLGTGHRILATVFVECHAMWRASGPAALRPVGEAEFVAGIAAMSDSGHYGPTRIAAGIVAHADLALGEAVRPVLEALAAASGGRLRGIRHITAWDAAPETRSSSVLPPPGLLGDAGFRRGFAQLARHGLSFDAWLFHPQLPELIALARAFPETAIILDHAGGPLGVGPYAGHRQAVFAEWRDAMRALAACSNVRVKLGGVGMPIYGFGLQGAPTPPNSEQLARLWRPYVETCIEAFGAGRCMFESNFPVDKTSCSYDVLWNAFKRLAAGASAAERDALFRGTAAETYRLVLPDTD